MKCLVTGAGGFIGWHLANRLVDEGHDVYAADVRMPQFKPCKAQHFQIIDLRYPSHVRKYFADHGPFDEVYALAADMGGIGYITEKKADVMRNNVMINCNCIEAALKTKAQKYLFTSSACVYPEDLQNKEAMQTAFKNIWQLKESDAYPAMCEAGYGWEKLFSEQLCHWYWKEFGLETKIVRLHNIYGPYGTYKGGREKAPAALCRKVLKADTRIEIWGSGNQVRTFCYIDDAVEGLVRIMRSNWVGRPINLGSDVPITINKLADMIIRISGFSLGKFYNHKAPVGVYARSSDNSLLESVIGWTPSITYEEGMAKTYEWIESEITKGEK